uniref:Rhodanese domain-containing protein n=1 Tax=Macrostomum lignano TaxID=282301 RepID=A0A1I8F568_9PLAT
RRRSQRRRRSRGRRLAARLGELRPEASRHVILVACDECHEGRRTLQSVRQSLLESGVRLHLLTEEAMPTYFFGRRSQAFGVDSGKAFSLESPEGSAELHGFTRRPAGKCGRLAAESGGSVFDLRFLRRRQYAAAGPSCSAGSSPTVWRPRWRPSRPADCPGASRSAVARPAAAAPATPDLSSAVKAQQQPRQSGMSDVTPQAAARPPSPSRRRGPKVKSYLHKFYCGGGGAGGSGALDEGAAPPADAATVDASDEMRRLLASGGGGGGKQRRGCHLRPIVWKAMLWIGINCLIFGALGLAIAFFLPHEPELVELPGVQGFPHQPGVEPERANVLKYVALGVFSVGAVVTAVGLILPSLVWRLFDEDEQLNSATDPAQAGRRGAKRSGGFGGCCSDRRWPGCRARPSPPGWRRPPLRRRSSRGRGEAGAAAEEPRGGSRLAQQTDTLGGWPKQLTTAGRLARQLTLWELAQQLTLWRLAQQLTPWRLAQQLTPGGWPATDTPGRLAQQLTLWEAGPATDTLGGWPSN